MISIIFFLLLFSLLCSYSLFSALLSFLSTSLSFSLSTSSVPYNHPRPLVLFCLFLISLFSASLLFSLDSSSGNSASTNNNSNINNIDSSRQKAVMRAHGVKFGMFLSSLVSVLSVDENTPLMSHEDMQMQMQLERRNGKEIEEDKYREECSENTYPAFEAILLDIQGNLMKEKKIK